MGAVAHIVGASIMLAGTALMVESGVNAYDGLANPCVISDFQTNTEYNLCLDQEQKDRRKDIVLFIGGLGGLAVGYTILDRHDEDW